MKKILLLLSLLFLTTIISIGQERFDLEIEEISINDAPGLHSFSWGKTSDGKWLVIGGRTEGLHKRRPFESFSADANNTYVFVIDIESGKTWSKTLSSLPASIYEQLQSTNQEFYQTGNTLYIVGGYGYSATERDHITYPYLTAVDVDGAANAVISNGDLTTFFRQIMDSNFAVTGGQMGYLDGRFYLCGGQYFKGRYNPMGGDHGSGFTQVYTDAIRKFKINDDGTDISISDFEETKDRDNLHRRDYNMSPQIFPDGSHGFTMFTGVFQIQDDLPFLNIVDVNENGYKVNNDFTMYLSHYHSAKLPIYDTENNEMHTVFFGGMSQYQIDPDGKLIRDDNVPFVKTISMVTRNSAGKMSEKKLNIEMPGLMGSGAEFIPLNDDFYINGDILDLNKLPEGRTLVGYIYGGITSSQANIFFINDGTQSHASKKIFKVYINKNVTSVDETVLTADNIFSIKVYPNPAHSKLSVEFFVPNKNNHFVTLYSIKGERLLRQTINGTIGNKKIDLDLSNFPAGQYILEIKGGAYSANTKIIKK